MADDFCSAATAQSMGIIRGAAWWYVNWTGRFSANFLDNFFGYLGPRITPFVTIIVLVIWLSALTLAVLSLFRLIQERVSISLSGLTAAAILFVTIEITPNIGQSLYWGEGMRYLIPSLILATVLVAVLAKSVRMPNKKSAYLVVCGTLTFIAGGFSETYVTVQTVSLVFALTAALTLCRTKQRLTSSLVAGLLGSVAALLFVAFAPGNAVRGTPFPKPTFSSVFRVSLAGFIDFFNKSFVSSLSWVSVAGLAAFALVLGALLVDEKRRPPALSLMALWPVVGMVLLFTCQIPIAYGASLNLPDRTLVILCYLLVTVLFIWSFLVGMKLRAVFTNAWARGAGVAAVIVFAGIAAYAGVRRVTLKPVFSLYAREWEARDQTIRAARARGERTVQVKRLYNWAALDEVEPDPKILWLTKCVQDYYGIAVLTDYDGRPDPNAAARQRQTEIAAEAIKPPSFATEVTLNSNYRPGRGVVQFFKTDASYDQVKTYYESQLTQAGWHRHGERKLEIFQRYPRAMQALFCKDGYAANVFYTGDEAQRLGYNFSLAINWGISSGYLWGVEDCKY